MPSVDCTGLTKEEVLVWLCNNNTGYHDKRVPLTIEEARNELNDNNDIDYLKGRCLKLDFSTFPILNTEYYDRDNKVTASEQIARLKAGTDLHFEEWNSLMSKYHVSIQITEGCGSRGQYYVDKAHLELQEFTKSHDLYASRLPSIHKVTDIGI